MSGLRRITVSKFNGKQMISIREYYEKGGETLPGKKVRIVFAYRTLSPVAGTNRIVLLDLHF